MNILECHIRNIPTKEKRCRAPTNMADVTKNRTYGKIAGFWVISQKPLIISEI
jgi:hypothetical protein